MSVQRFTLMQRDARGHEDPQPLNRIELNRVIELDRITDLQ